MTTPATNAGALLRAIDALCAEDSALGLKIEKSLAVLQNAFDTFSIERTCFCFNGGKDSTVVLHLLRAAIARSILFSIVSTEGDDNAEEVGDVLGGPAVLSGASHGQAQGLRAPVPAESSSDDIALCTSYTEAFARMPILFFRNVDEFPEVLSFIDATTREMGLTLIEFECSYKDGVAQLVDEGRLKAVTMGQRRGDPFTADMDYFSPSSDGWPDFMRVSPVLDWSYSDVWRFLRQCGLPYCSLYDDGYTSLGNVKNTQRNPALRCAAAESAVDDDRDAPAVGKFLPAHRLEDGALERKGRA
eukprot:g307.t1